MLPHLTLIGVGHGIDAVLARILRVAHSLDLARPVEALASCSHLADEAHLVELTEGDPLGWPFPAAVGLDRLNGATSAAAACIGELPDQDFARGVLVPTYLEAIAADQPVEHRIAAVVNNTLLSYRRIAVPLYATPRSGRASHLLMLAGVDCAMPGIDAHRAGHRLLTFRERQCLSLAASGLVAKQVAAEIGASEKTVELHLARARHKLGARNTAHAVAISLAMAMMDG